tara:strand:+ start:201 stop:1052 length:852 start_codon:yes stop_codon:yes gene_type:complete
MIQILLEPFQYDYMVNAIFVSSLVGAICAFLSCYIIMRGWSLIGDALSHAIVPGVAGAYMLGLPFTIGAFLTGTLAASIMLFLNEKTNLKEDAIIGIIFTSFFAIGLFMISVSPSPIDIQTIVLGNILSITPSDTAQLIIISIITLSILILRWKDLMLLFYDEAHAQSIGIKPKRLKLIFFILLSVSTVAAMQTVGAFLVIAMVVTPGATAFLLVDRFSKLILISVSIGIFSCAFGTYSSYFLDGATGGMIILIQTILFILAFLLSPKYGYIKNISNRKKQRN